MTGLKPNHSSHRWRAQDAQQLGGEAQHRPAACRYRALLHSVGPCAHLASLLARGRAHALSLLPPGLARYTHSLSVKASATSFTSRAGAGAAATLCCCSPPLLPAAWWKGQPPPALSAGPAAATAAAAACAPWCAAAAASRRRTSSKSARGLTLSHSPAGGAGAGARGARLVSGRLPLPRLMLPACPL